MKRRAAVQTVHLNLEAIEDGVVRLVGGRYRAILEVGSVNFGLVGQSEREGIIAGYAAFLNGLTFPVQALVRVLPVDLDAYLADLERQAQTSLAEPLTSLARDYGLFLRRLARHRTLLERRFYLVVPAQADTNAGGPRWRLGRAHAGLDLDAARRQLTFRCEEVERQLGRCGLTVRRLGDTELAQLTYACWCPDLARVQRLQRRLTEYTALVVNGATQTPRRS